MTLEEMISGVCEQHPWTAAWFRLGEIIVSDGNRTWATKNPSEMCPANMNSLGCMGVNAQGRLAWIGWDLDVGHGRASYANTEDALVDARHIRDTLEGRAEIRLSKSGVGVHVRHLVEGEDLPAAEGPRRAKLLAVLLNIKADPSALGRQAFWLWTRKAPVNAFKLIEPHAVHESLAEID